MPKDARGRKGAHKKGAPRRRETLAERVARLRAAVDGLSERLASAEEMLLAAGQAAIGQAEQRTSRILTTLSEAGGRIEAELGAAVAAAMGDRPPRRSQPSKPPAGRGAPTAGRRAAGTRPSAGSPRKPASTASRGRGSTGAGPQTPSRTRGGAAAPTTRGRAATGPGTSSPPVSRSPRTPRRRPPGAG